MAELRLPGGAQHPLATESLIGRSRRCEIRLKGQGISSRHALIRWTGTGWEIRDLGSRNGTWVGSSRLEAGARVLLEAGQTLRLGDIDLAVTDVSPPALFARGPQGHLVRAEGGLLSLPPGSDTPLTQVYRSDTGAWVVEQDGAVQPAGEELSLDGADWELFLPEQAADTVALSAVTSDTIGLHFRVSADEEWVQMVVRHPSGDTPLKARTHHYLLLTLARHRLDHQKEDVPPDGQGWLSMEALERMLRIPRVQVNLQVFRARKQLAAAGIHNAAAVIERRDRYGQLRIGVAQLSVERL